MRAYIFHDLDPVQKRLAQHAEDIGYLILAEVTGRHNTEKLGRMDFTPTDLHAYLQPEERPPEEFPEAGQPDEDVEGDEEEPTRLGAAIDDPTPVDLADAAYRWVKETAGENMNSLKRCKFKLSVWSPKGDKLLYCTRFSCENPDWMDDDPEQDEPVERKPPALVPAPSGFAMTAPGAATLAPGTVVVPQVRVAPEAALAMLMLDAIPEGRVWKALGGGFEQLLHLYQEGFGTLTRLQNTALGTHNTQILRNQKVLEDLMAQLITLRVGVAAADNEQKEEAQGARVREELGKQFIAEMGGLGRAVAAAKFGMAPELMELADIVSASPELAEALKAPEVRKMLRDEKTRKELAELLVLAAKSVDPTPPTPANTPPKDEPKAA